MEGIKKVLKPSPVKSVASQAKRGVIDSCQLCQKRFSPLRQEHQCKRCARAVCSDCSKTKAKIISYEVKPNDAHRVCKLCKDEIEFQQDFRTKNSLSFGENSEIGLKWARLFGIIGKETQVDDLQRLEKIYKNEVEKDIGLIYQLDKTKRLLNYSQLEFVYYVTQKEKEKTINDVINQLIRKLSNYLQWEKQPPKIDMLCLYILGFCKDWLAFAVISFIYLQLLPEYALEFLTRQEDLSESETWNSARQLLNQTCKQTFKLSEEESKLANAFILNEGREMLSTFLIKDINFQCFHHIFEQMASVQRFEEWEKSFMALIKLNIGLLKVPQTNLHLEILRHTGIFSLKKIKTEYEPQLLLASQMIEQQRSSSKFEMAEVERLREELQRTKEELDIKNKEIEQRSESFQPISNSVDDREMNRKISQLIGDSQENITEKNIEGDAEKLKTQLEEVEKLNQQREQEINALKEQLMSKNEEISTLLIEIEKAKSSTQEVELENQKLAEKNKTQEIELDQEKQKAIEFQLQLDDAKKVQKEIQETQEQEKNLKEMYDKQIKEIEQAHNDAISLRIKQETEKEKIFQEQIDMLNTQIIELKMNKQLEEEQQKQLINQKQQEFQDQNNSLRESLEAERQSNEIEKKELQVKINKAEETATVTQDKIKIIELSLIEMENQLKHEKDERQKDINLREEVQKELEVFKAKLLEAELAKDMNNKSLEEKITELERVAIESEQQKDQERITNEELINIKNEELNKKGEMIKKYDAELRKMGEEIQRKNIDFARQEEGIRMKDEEFKKSEEEILALRNSVTEIKTKQKQEHEVMVASIKEEYERKTTLLMEQMGNNSDKERLELLREQYNAENKEYKSQIDQLQEDIRISGQKHQNELDGLNKQLNQHKEQIGQQESMIAQLTEKNEVSLRQFNETNEQKQSIEEDFKIKLAEKEAEIQKIQLEHVHMNQEKDNNTTEQKNKIEKLTAQITELEKIIAQNKVEKEQFEVILNETKRITEEKEEQIKSIISAKEAEILLQQQEKLKEINEMAQQLAEKNLQGEEMTEKISQYEKQLLNIETNRQSIESMSQENNSMLLQKDEEKAKLKQEKEAEIELLQAENIKVKQDIEQKINQHNLEMEESKRVMSIEIDKLKEEKEGLQNQFEQIQADYRKQNEEWEQKQVEQNQIIEQKIQQYEISEQNYKNELHEKEQLTFNYELESKLVAEETQANADLLKETTQKLSEAESNLINIERKYNENQDILKSVQEKCKQVEDTLIKEQLNMKELEEGKKMVLLELIQTQQQIKELKIENSELREEIVKKEEEKAVYLANIDNLKQQITNQENSKEISNADTMEDSKKQENNIDSQNHHENSDTQLQQSTDNLDSSRLANLTHGHSTNDEHQQCEKQINKIPFEEQQTLINTQSDLPQGTLPRKPQVVVPPLKNFPPKSYETSPEMINLSKSDSGFSKLESAKGESNQMFFSPRDLDQHKSTLELQLQVKSLEKKNSQLRESIVSLKDLYKVNGELQKLLGEKETKINSLKAANKEIEQELASTKSSDEYHKNKLVSVSEQLSQFENFEEKLLELKNIGFEKFEPIKEKLDDLKEIAENKAEMTGVIYRFATGFKQELDSCKRSQARYVEKIHELSMTNSALFEQNDEMTQILLQNDIQLSGIQTKNINSTQQNKSSIALNKSQSLNYDEPIVRVLKQNKQRDEDNDFDEIQRSQNTSCTGPECSIF